MFKYNEKDEDDEKMWDWFKQKLNRPSKIPYSKFDKLTKNFYLWKLFSKKH
jgi:hypothetical protein